MPPSRQWAKRLHRGHSLGDSGNRRARRFYDAAGWSVDGATTEAVIADVPVREVRHCRGLWAMPGSRRSAAAHLTSEWSNQPRGGRQSTQLAVCLQPADLRAALWTKVVLQNEPPAARLVAQVRGRGRPGDRTATTSARSGSLRCGILGVTGPHSEAPPEGEFCALRLRVANPDPAFHTFVAARQRLAGVEPPRDAPSGFAMAVRRQHDQVELGGQN